jgi:hypothetical protein
VERPTIFLVLLGARGHHHDEGVAEAADLPAGLDAVDSRQAEVEHDHIRRVAAGELDRLLAVGGALHLEPFAGEVGADDLDQPRLVVDDERMQAAWALPGRYVARSQCHAHPVSTNWPCHQCGQTTPLPAFTEIIPSTWPLRSVSSV